MSLHRDLRGLAQALGAPIFGNVSVYRMVWSGLQVLLAAAKASRRASTRISFPDYLEFTPTEFTEDGLIAEFGAGNDPGRGRAEVQGRITEHLSDPDRVRSLLAEAPDEARDMLRRLVQPGAVLATYCFEQQDPYSGKYVFAAGGSGDPDADWLARPAAADR